MALDPALVRDGRFLAAWEQLTAPEFRGIDPPAGYGWQQGLAPALPDGSYVVAPQYLFSPTAGDDAVWINNAITQGGQTGVATGGTMPGVVVRLMPLSYNMLSGPAIVDRNAVTLRGAAWGGTILKCGYTTAQSALLIVGNTQIVTQPVVTDLVLDANSNADCNHGWVLRAEVPYGSNVTVKNLNSNGDMFHFSPGDLTGTARDTYEMYNLFGANTSGTGNGLYLDAKVTSSEFFGCHFNGAVTNAGSGGYGINDNGNSNKFYGCHPYFWTSGAYINNNGQGPLIMGGEWENCVGPNFTFNGTKFGCISKAQSYGTVNTGTDVVLENGAAFCDLDGIRHNSVNVTLLYSLDGTCHDNSINHAKSFAAIAAAVNAASGANKQIIALNDFQGGTITHSGGSDIVVNNL